jgi:NAD(P)-dependent dehydrogenase (short-subunit alcohol dehydrogenase family)
MSGDRRVAIVTGGSQGIGLATVRAFAARGMTVVAAARDRGRLDKAVAGIAPAGDGRVLGIAADVAAEADVARLVAETVERCGALDVVVNAAGVSMSARTPVAASMVEEWRRIVDTNLTGTYLVCRAALPHLVRAADAWILNVQSTAAHRAQAGVGLYAASKFGVRALTEALIEEHRHSNIRVSAVSPGPVDTTIWGHKVEPPSAERRARMLRPEDIADILTWLLDRPRNLHIPDITVTPWMDV